jgi:hypothetical protein
MFVCFRLGSCLLAVHFAVQIFRIIIGNVSQFHWKIFWFSLENQMNERTMRTTIYPKSKMKKQEWQKPSECWSKKLDKCEWQFVYCRIESSKCSINKCQKQFGTKHSYHTYTWTHAFTHDKQRGVAVYAFSKLLSRRAHF